MGNSSSTSDCCMTSDDEEVFGTKLKLDSGSDEDCKEDIVVNKDTFPVKKEVFNWIDDYKSFRGREETFKHESEVEIKETDPYKLFTAIWDDEIMEKIVQETNKFAQQSIKKIVDNGGIILFDCILSEWKDTTKEELFTFFGMMISMNSNLRDSLSEYWTNGFLMMPIFKSLMTKKRFKLLLKFLHFMDNSVLDFNVHGLERKLEKLSPILDHCNNKFLKMYTPGRYLAVDRFANEVKGVKFMSLIESETGYTLKIANYQKPVSEENNFKKLSEKTTLELLDNYLNRGHCVIFKNYSESFELIRHLKENKTDVLGALNRKSDGVPNKIKFLRFNVMKKGSIVGQHCGDISVVAWKHKDVLYPMISTYHRPNTSFYRPQCNKVDPYQAPNIVIDYNKYKNKHCFDFDHVADICTLEKDMEMKWYLRIFKRLLESSIINCYTIYCANIQDEQKMPYGVFRIELYSKLCFGKETYPGPEPSIRLDRIDHTLNAKRVVCVARTLKKKKDGKKKDKYRRRKCVRCLMKDKNSYTSFFCTKCKVYLCLNRCYIEYHTVYHLSRY